MISSFRKMLAPAALLFLFLNIVPDVSAGNIWQSTTTNKYKPSIVVVGAGVAGLGATTRLLEHNFTNIIVLEAMDRVGGRVHSKPLDYGKGFVDLGAHWIHSENDNAVYDLAKSMGLVRPSGDYANNLLYNAQGKNVRLGKSFLQMFDILVEGMNKLTEPEKNMTYEEYIIKRVRKLIHPLGLPYDDERSIERLVSKCFCDLEGCGNLQDVSLERPTDYEDREGDRLMEWTSGGMYNIINILLGRHARSPWKHLDTASKIRLSSRVIKVDWSMAYSNKIYVTTQYGSVIAADYVILTPSLNVLKARHTRMFNPPLPPNKVDAIQSLGMDVVDKIYLVFNQRWWPMNVTGFAPLHNVEYPSQTKDWGEDIILFVSEHFNPNILCGLILGRAARAMERCSDQQVLQTAMRILRKYMGKAYSIPEPLQMVRTRWESNVDVHGSYSFNHKNADHIAEPRKDLERPLTNKHGKPVVLFAGEATDTERYATVHGALESGWREADRIIKIENNNV